MENEKEDTKNEVGLAPLISETAIQRRRRSISELEERLHSRSRGSSVQGADDETHSVHERHGDIDSINKTEHENDEINKVNASSPKSGGNRAHHGIGRQLDLDLGGAQIHLHRSGSLVLHVDHPSGSDSEEEENDAAEGMTELDNYLISQGVNPVSIVQDAKRDAESQSPTQPKGNETRQKSSSIKNSSYKASIGDESPSDLEGRLERLENFLKSEMTEVEQSSQSFQNINTYSSNESAHSPLYNSHNTGYGSPIRSPIQSHSPQTKDQPFTSRDNLQHTAVYRSPASQASTTKNTKYFESWRQENNIDTIISSTDGMSMREEYIGSAEQQEWEDLNRLLEKVGFKPIPLYHTKNGTRQEPELQSIVPIIRSILAEYQRRPRSDLDAQEKEWEALRKLSQCEESVRQLERKLELSQVRVRELEEDLETESRKKSTKMRNLEQENSTLKQRVAHSEHRVKAKENLIERMQQKLDQEIQRQSVHKTRDRQVFTEIHRRAPTPTSRKDQQMLETIGTMEDEREKLLSEIDFLRVENRKLSSSLRDRENMLQHQSGSPLSPASPPVSGFQHPAQLMERLRIAEKDQQEAKTRLHERERMLEQQVSKLERQVTKSMEEKVAVEEDYENLKLELSSRPSIRDWRESQHRIRLLERQIEAAIEQLEEQSELERIANSTTMEPKRATRLRKTKHREVIEQRAKALEREGQDNHRLTDTRSLIRQDRMNHFLGLNKFRNLSKETMVDNITEVCRELELTNPERVVPTLMKMKEKLKHYKQLQRFAKETVSYVLVNRLHEDVNHSPLIGSLEKVLSVLKQWSQEANELVQLRKFRELIAGEVIKSITSTNELAGVQNHISLVEPAVATAERQGLADEQIIREVRELVSMERTIMMRKEAFLAADKQVASHPEVMVNRVVKHFQHLFNVRSIEGMFPKLNELYVFSTEMTNFLKVLRPILGLSSSASVNTVLVRIQDVVERQFEVSHHKDLHLQTRPSREAQKRKDEFDPLSTKPIPFSQEYFVTKEQGLLPEWS